jgi:[ribosomal protein S18]-alanine N-acetyltransferase
MRAMELNIHYPIRRAIHTDALALHALEKLSFQTDQMSLRQIRRHLHSKTAELFLVQNQREVLGCILIFFRQQKFRGDLVFARIYSLAVSPRARGQGLGKALLLAGIESCKHRRARSVRLEVRSDNMSAIALYHAFGFQVLCTLPGYYQDGSNGVRMCLEFY